MNWTIEARAEGFLSLFIFEKEVFSRANGTLFCFHSMNYSNQHFHFILLKLKFQKSSKALNIIKSIYKFALTFYFVQKYETKLQKWFRSTKKERWPLLRKSQSIILAWKQNVNSDLSSKKLVQDVMHEDVYILSFNMPNRVVYV